MGGSANKITLMKRFFLLTAFLSFLFAGNIYAQDSVANNMLLYQRNIGGWPKHIGNKKIDYTKYISPAEKAAIIDDAGMNDATIDNNATSKEIRYLLKAYKKTADRKYLLSAEKGIRYLLVMQNSNAGRSFILIPARTEVKLPSTTML